MATLVRISGQSHYFIDKPLVSAKGQWRGCGSTLLASLEGHPLTCLQSLIGFGLDPHAWFARLLKHRRDGIASEVSGRWAAASFYFDECVAKLKSRGPEHQVWHWLAGECAKSGGCILPGEIYRTFIDELFLDMHCGFYNGYGGLADGSRAAARRPAHINYLRDLLSLSHAPDETWFQLLAPALEEEYSRCKTAAEFASGVALAEELLKRFPRMIKYADLSAHALFEQAVKSLSDGKSESGAHKDAMLLAAPVTRLEELVRQCPDSLGTFQCASDLHRLRAIRMANSGDVSDAMVEIQKSLAYWPGDHDAEEDAKKIAELIRGMQRRAAELDQALAANSQASLSASGVKIKREAAAGFRPANEFVNSKEYKQITESWERAQLHALWLDVGLSIPEDHWDEKAAKLLAAIPQAREKLSERASAFPGVWREIFAVDPDLAQLDRERIRRYLFNEPTETDAVESPSDAPRMEVNPNGRRGTEPLWAWLWTAQNPLLKLQAGAALLLLLLSLLLGGYRAVRLHQREAAWRDLESASAAGDSLNQLIDCERFFSTSPPAEDPRIEQARNIYRDALSRWFAGLPGAPDSEARRHIQKYAEVSAKRGEGGML